MSAGSPTRPVIFVENGDVDAAEDDLEVDVVLPRQEVLHLVQLRLPPDQVLAQVLRLDLNLWVGGFRAESASTRRRCKY